MKRNILILLVVCTAGLLVTTSFASEPDRTTIVQIDDVLDAYDNDNKRLGTTVQRLRQLTTEHPQSSAVWIRLAVGQARLGDYSGAKDSVARLLALDPTHVQGLAVRGNIAWKTGDISAARTDFQTVLQSKPRHPVANNFKAFEAIKAGQFKEAVNHARNALVGNPKNLNSYALMAYAYHRMNDPYMARLVALSGNEIADTFADSYNILGLIENDSDQLGLAGTNLRKALELEPGHVGANLNLAMFALSVSDFETALKHLEIVERSEPNNVKSVLAKGVALRGLKKYHEAEAAYLRVLQLEPDNLDVRYNLCVVTQEYMQDLEGALKWCGQFATRIGKRHPKYKEMVNRISGIRATLEMMKDSANEPATDPEVPKDDKKSDPKRIPANETPKKP